MTKLKSLEWIWALCFIQNQHRLKLVSSALLLTWQPFKILIFMIMISLYCFAFSDLTTRGFWIVGPFQQLSSKEIGKRKENLLIEIWTGNFEFASYTHWLLHYKIQLLLEVILIWFINICRIKFKIDPKLHPS